MLEKNYQANMERCKLTKMNDFLSLRGFFLNRMNIGIGVRWATATLAFKEHLAQGFHHLVVGRVQVVKPSGQQFHGLPNPPWLVDGALLADAQVHRQV